MRRDSGERWINAVLGLFAGGMVLFGASYLVWRRIQLGFLTPLDKLLIAGCCLAAVVLLLIIVKGKRTWKLAALYLAIVGVVVETQLQIVAFIGALPSVNFSEEIPYARVYWTKEGFGNSWMNRFGWHYPEFELGRDSGRVALIGDSFIEALQVQPIQNIGVVLQDLLNKGAQKRSEQRLVIAMGKGGFGPAGYLELLKFARERYHVTDAIVFLSLGSAFKNALVEIESKNGPQYMPSRYVYYTLDPTGNLALHPESRAAQALLRQQLQMNHAGLLRNWAGTAKSNCMLFMVVNQLLQNVTTGDVIFPKKRSIAGGLGPGMAGIEDLAFDKNRPPLARKAMTIVQGLLEEYRQYAQREKMALMIVTIPWFPNCFFDTRDWTNWGFPPDKYDFLLPESELIDWCSKKDLPLLPMGHLMRDARVDVDLIRGLYYSNGSGHWTVSGHRYWAKTIYETFYRDQRRNFASVPSCSRPGSVGQAPDP